MHWLAEQFEALTRLAEDHRLARERRRAGTAASDDDEAVRRREMLARIDDVVARVAEREGVLACFASHDGLLVTGVGPDHDLEALAAMSQWALMPARHTSATLDLGDVGQLLIAGRDRKLALLQVGEITLGILAPSTTDLGEALAR